ncbi:MAG: chemotaxis protein CheA [Bacteroidales bacterium]|nr:chemotaxis protein CheA [Bacteroidales bacterium]
MDKFAQKYIEEATEIIAKLEELVLEVEKQPENKEMINEIFRLMHTLKGGGAMFGFKEITDVTHELESIYDYIRNDKAKISKELLDKSLEIVDYVKKILENPNKIDIPYHKEKVEELEKLKNKFKDAQKNVFKNGEKINTKLEKPQNNTDKTTDKNLKVEKKTTEVNIKNEEKQKVEKVDEIEKVEEKIDSVENDKEYAETEKESGILNKIIEKKPEFDKNSDAKIKTYKIYFKPHKDTMKNGTDPLLLLREISELGVCKIYSITDLIPPLNEIIYDNLHLCWMIFLATDNRNGIDDVFIFIEDEATIDIEPILSGNAFENKEFLDQLDEIANEEIEKQKKKCKSNEIQKNSSSNDNIEKTNTIEVNKKEKIFNINDETGLFEDFEDEITENEVLEDEIIEEETKEEITNSQKSIEDFTIKTKEQIIAEKLDELEKITKEVAEKSLTDNNVDIINQENSTNDETIQIAEIETSSKKITTISSLRVSAEKVDTLMNLVSELITTQARLSEYADSLSNPELESIAENMQKLSRQLRDNAFELSMVPLQSVVLRFQRLVRDLSSQLNKDVIFKTDGTETELDKRIIENLIDPIMHLLRNSLDHGIESKEERLKTGKSAVTNIFLKAFYSGSNVFIQVGDDGRGIDIEKIQKKAIENGLLKPKTQYKKEEVLNIIFEPGFSTAVEVSQVSGRGVGLDVVKRKVGELRGEIKVDTEPGFGTVFTIKLPLTLSIIDGLLVTVGNTKYVIPMNVVHKIYAIKHSDLEKSHYNLLILDEKQIPYYYLREEFGETTETLPMEQVLVINHEDNLVGIVVDKVIGEYQAVIKTLGRLYNDQQIFSGATILGDGSVALVMDVKKIVDSFSVLK